MAGVPGLKPETPSPDVKALFIGGRWTRLAVAAKKSHKNKNDAIICANFVGSSNYKAASMAAHWASRLSSGTMMLIWSPVFALK